MTRFPLRTLRLRSGQEWRDEVPVELASFTLGGERYLPVPPTVAAELVVARASSGDVFALAFDVRLHGPCMRCLEDAVLAVHASGREYQANDPGGDENLRTEYVVDGHLELGAWARDLIADALPDQVLCRPDCPGLCAECGLSLSSGPHDHAAPSADPRWSALERLRDEL